MAATQQTRQPRPGEQPQQGGQTRPFRMPDVGEGLTEADIVAWHVAPGDRVSDGQVIVEVETAKAIVELPCPFDGTVAEVLAEPGSTVEVGTPIITVTADAVAGAEADAAAGDSAAGGREAAATDRARQLAEDLVPAAAPQPPQQVAAAPDQAPPPEEADESAAPPEERREAVLVGYGVRPSSTHRRPRRTAPTSSAPTAAPARPSTPPVAAKPPVRKLARDLGVDLASVTPTGPGGTVTRDDVTAAQTDRAQPVSGQPSAAPAPARSDERIPVRGVRRATAQAMVASAFTAPHVTEWVQVDVTRSVKLVRRLRALPEFAEVKVSPLLLAVRALLAAVHRHPRINASWDEAAQEIVVHGRVNVGVAAATPRGLLVPNVKDADRLTTLELAQALTALTVTAREGRTTPADLSGGTITVTNVGVFGVDGGTPILNPGEAAILAVGAVRELPWVHKGKVRPRRVVTLSLSFDHRMVDGELGSRVLADVAAMLERPELLVAHS